MRAIVDKTNQSLRRVPAWTIYMAGAFWAAWLFYQGLTGALGPEPINTLERAYGLVGLKLLVLGLLITPLRKFTGLNLLKFRRAIGVTTFFFIVAHFTVWAVLDVQTLARVWADIVKRPYITVGMTALTLMVPLALTSNNLSVRRMGAAAWRRLHRLTYLIAVLGAVHYIWLVKGWQLQPFVYLAIILALLVLRVRFVGPWLSARRA